jgi:hypothetical protein
MPRRKKKKKTESSTDQFTFKANDPMVREQLSASEIAAVKNWQTSGEYLFEFHEGHDQHYPIYFRPTSGISKTELNIPKVITKGKAKGAYGTLGSVEVSGKLTANLSNAAQQELEKIITKEWDTLVILARRYWADEAVPQLQVNPVRREMKCGKCGKVYSGEVDLGRSNDFGKYKCTGCGKEAVSPSK